MSVEPIRSFNRSRYLGHRCTVQQSKANLAISTCHNEGWLPGREKICEFRVIRRVWTRSSGRYYEIITIADVVDGKAVTNGLYSER